MIAPRAPFRFIHLFVARCVRLHRFVSAIYGTAMRRIHIETVYNSAIHFHLNYHACIDALAKRSKYRSEFTLN